MKITLLEGTHLTATNRRHMAELIGSNRLDGATKSLAYALVPVSESPRQFRYKICKSERDDWGRLAPRYSQGLIEVQQ